MIEEKEAKRYVREQGTIEEKKSKRYFESKG